MNISTSTQRPRMHHQWLPDILYVEEGISADSIELLIKKNHVVQLSSSFGSLQSIMLKDGLYYGAADTRRPNAKAVAIN